MSELFRFVGLRGPSGELKSDLKTYLVEVSGARAGEAAQADDGQDGAAGEEQSQDHAGDDQQGQDGAVGERPNILADVAKFLEGHNWYVTPDELKRFATSKVGGNARTFGRVVENKTVVEERNAAAQDLLRIALDPANAEVGAADQATSLLLTFALLVRLAEAKDNVSADEVQASRITDFASRAVIVLPDVGDMDLKDNNKPIQNAMFADGHPAVAAAIALPAEPANGREGEPEQLGLLESSRSAVEALTRTAATDEPPYLSDSALARIQEITDAGWDQDRIFFTMSHPIEVVIEKLDEKIQVLTSDLWARKLQSPGLPAVQLAPEPSKSKVPDDETADPIKFGIGDLMLAQVTATDYAYGDIAHIENVMASEERGRTHRRRDLQEVETLTESELESVTEQDNQSTDRFDLEREASKTPNEELKIEAGSSVSGSYGPVTASASFGMASTTSRASTDKQSARLSQEITAKASSKIRSATREQRRSLSITEVIETTHHGFKNVGRGARHISGIYRWVDRVQSIELRNYGQRLMLGLVLPEPGRFLRWRRERSGHGNNPPPEPLLVWRSGLPAPLEPADITPENYFAWIARTGATDMTRPPPRYKSESLALENDPSAVAEKPGYVTRASNTVTVPDGYRVIRVRGALIAYDTSELLDFVELPLTVKLPTAALVIGSLEVSRLQWKMGLQLPLVFDVPVGNEWPLMGTKSGGKIPVMLQATTSHGFAVTVEFVFERTSEALQDWQIKAYAAVLSAHQAALSKWESDRRAAGLGVIDFGLPSARKRQIERAELKRQCISLLAATEPGVDAVDDDDDDLPPRIDRHALPSLANQVANFDGVIEWEHMSWWCLDYFFADRASWEVLSQQADDDLDHQAFLAAGAAEVMLPVRPAYAAHLLYRLWRGVAWPGSRAPLIGGDFGKAVAGELVRQPMVPQEGVPVPGATWKERLPTTLVILQRGPSLQFNPDDDHPDTEAEAEEVGARDGVDADVQTDDH